MVGWLVGWLVLVAVAVACACACACLVLVLMLVLVLVLVLVVVVVVPNALVAKNALLMSTWGVVVVVVTKSK